MEKQKGLWSNMWHFRGCEDIPSVWRGCVYEIPASFWLLAVTITVLACRNQEWEAAPTESHFWSWAAGAIVQFGFHQTQQAGSAQSKGIPPPNSEGPLARCAISSWGCSFRDSLAHPKHIAPMRGRKGHPAPPLPQGSIQGFVGIAHHPLPLKKEMWLGGSEETTELIPQAG